MTDPAVTALTDQVQAAQAHATAALVRSAEKHGGTRKSTYNLTGTRAVIVSCLFEQIAARQLRTCRHIDGKRPLRQYWIAWNPREILCGPCMKPRLSHEAQTCDNCGDAIGHVVVVQLPAQVDGERPTAVGPTITMMALCDQCDDG